MLREKVEQNSFFREKRVAVARRRLDEGEALGGRAAPHAHGRENPAGQASRGRAAGVATSVNKKAKAILLHLERDAPGRTGAVRRGTCLWVPCQFEG